MITLAGLALIDQALGHAMHLTLLSVGMPLVSAFAGSALASGIAARGARRFGHGFEMPSGARAALDSVRSTVVTLTLAGVLVLLATRVLDGTAASAVGFAAAVTVVVAMMLLAPAAVVVPGLLGGRLRQRASLRAVGRMRAVSAPAAMAIGACALLSAVVLLSATSSGSDGAPQSVPQNGSRLVAIRAATRSDVRGTLVLPPDAVARVVGSSSAKTLVLHTLTWPDGAAVVNINGSALSSDASAYAVTGAALSFLRLPPGTGSSSEPGSRGPLLLGRRNAFGGGSWSSATSARPVTVDRSLLPDPLPHVFVNASTAARLRLRAGPAVVLVRLPEAIDRARLRSMEQRAGDEGLAVESELSSASVSSGISSMARRAFTIAPLGLSLLVGAFAAALVLAERREESRRTLLAGASPSDYRRAAAATAFTVGAAGVLLALAFGALLVGTTLAIRTSNVPVAALVESACLLATMPPLLAVGAFALARPPRTLGRFGRVPRDAADARA